MAGLKGKTIITTCANDKADKLEHLLLAKGAKVVNFPLIEIEPAQNENILAEKLSHLNSFLWLIFTSANGVKYFFYWLQKFKIEFNANQFNFAVIGKATNRELQNHNIQASYIGSGKDATEFATELLSVLGSAKQHILIPCGNIAMDSVEQVLNTHHQIEKLVVYYTTEAESMDADLKVLIEQNKYDMVMFLSPSSVRGFFTSVGSNTKLSHFKAIPIGVTTQSEIEKFGYASTLIPEIPNIDAMIEALDQYFKKENN